MRHTHTFIIAKLSCKPPGDLLWRPVQSQLLCHQAGQLRVFGQVALLGPQSSIPSTLIRDMSSVPPPLRAVTRNLPADTRGRSPKAPRDLADRSVSAKPTRNLLSLRKSQGSSRTTAYSRRDAPIRSNDTKERICLLVHPPRHLGKRLACLPPLPYLNPCFNRQPRTTTHVQPPNPLQAGSCCIDRLRSPAFCNRKSAITPMELGLNGPGIASIKGNVVMRAFTIASDGLRVMNGAKKAS